MEAATEILGAPCCSSAEQVMNAARDCQEMMHVLFYLDFSCTCPLGLIMNPYECIFFHLVSAGYGDLRRISIKAMGDFGPGECMWGRLRGVAAKVPGHPVYRLARR